MLLRPAVLLCLLALSLAPAPARAESDIDPNRLEGIITRLDSPTLLSVSGTPVELGPGVTFASVVGHTSTLLQHPPVLFLGETLQLIGHPRHKKPFLAETVRLPAPGPVPVSGTGLIDRVLPPLPPSPAHPAPAHLVRADGYLLSLPASVLAPSAAKSLAPNQILSYRGTLQPDGAVEVIAALVDTPSISDTEDKLRERTNYDQDVMDAAARSTPQTRLSRHFKGIDLGRLPLVEDPALQARVDRIGRSLLPLAQRTLPPKDPNFIAFHFRVVDTPHDLHQPIPLTSGTVLLPAEALTHLQADHPTDAQLDSRIASALAVSIADIREKHLVRAIELNHKLLAPTWAAYAAGGFVPGLGLAADITAGSIAEHAAHLRSQQDNRIALALLHDAGYDLTQAGIASALLDAGSPKPFEQLKLTPDTLDLFTDLGRLYSPGSLAITLPPPVPTPPLPPSATASATPPAS